jgi:RNA polymerase sigma-70 factor (ECF subfamily)
MIAALQIDLEIATAIDPAPPHAAAVIDAETFLVRRLRAGDEGAYGTLMRTHAARLLAVARRIVRHEDDARDVVQEAWLRAFRALPGFEGQARLSTWLHRIVVNAALMKLRSQRRRPEASLDETPIFAECGSDANEEPSGEEALLAEERRALVRRALARLPESHRSVLVLRDFEELDTEETARRLGTSAGAVKTRLHRARNALREAIEREQAALGGIGAAPVAEAAV